MIGNVIGALIKSVKEGMLGMESVKNISKGYSGESVCGIGHIEVGGRCRMGLTLCHSTQILQLLSISSQNCLTLDVEKQH